MTLRASIGTAYSDQHLVHDAQEFKAMICASRPDVVMLLSVAMRPHEASGFKVLVIREAT